MKRKCSNVRKRLRRLRERRERNRSNRNVSEFDKLAYVPRMFTFLTGLISYESIFTDEKFSEIKEIVAVFGLAAIGIVQGIFLLMTAITEWRQDIYTGLTLIPYVLAGAAASVQALPFYFRKGAYQNFYRELRSLDLPENVYTVNDATASVIKKYRFTLRLGLGLVITAGLLFILRPFYGIAMYNLSEKSETFLDTKVYDTLYPFAVDTVPKYVACNLWEAYTVVYICTVRIAIDSGFVQSAAFISWHLQLLGRAIRTVVTRRNRHNESALLERLHKLAHHHSVLLGLCRKLENLFNHVILSVLVYTGLTLGVSVVTVQKGLSDNNYVGSLSFTVYFLCVVMETFIFCDSADMITHWSGDISQAVFDCRWTGCSEKFKKSMRIIMAVAQKGYQFKAYGFYQVNRVQVAKILLLAVNIVTVIRAVKLKRGY